MFDYNQKDIFYALKKVGLKKNDNVFCHSNIGFFGKLGNFGKFDLLKKMICF